MTFITKFKLCREELRYLVPFLFVWKSPCLIKSHDAEQALSCLCAEHSHLGWLLSTRDYMCGITLIYLHYRFMLLGFLWVILEWMNAWLPETVFLFPVVILLILLSVLLCQACHNKVLQTRWHKPQKFIFSQLKKLEV